MSVDERKREIYLKLQQVLSEMLKVPIDKIQLEARLSEELGIDSLDFFDVVVRISESFNIKVSADEELPIFLKVIDVVDFVEGKMSGDER